MRRPFGDLFLGAGAMKSGTTWLYAALRRHPDLHFATEKELHYFYHRHVPTGFAQHRAYLRHVNDRILRPPPEGSPLPPVTPLRRAAVNLHWLAAWLLPGLADPWYARLFSHPGGETWACDFSNLYALLPADAWARIASRSRRLRVLYTLRDPVERLWSHARFELQQGGKPDLAARWGADDFAAFLRRPDFWVHAEYGAAIRRMKAGLPAGCLKVAVFEDIHAAPREGLAGIEAFLGVAPAAYPRWLMTRKINPAPEIPMPDFFPDLVAGDVARIVAEVAAEGVAVPESWRRG